MTTAAPSGVWRTTTAQSTVSLGAALGRSLIGGVTIGLVGPLGAGKTRLVQGIAAGNAGDDKRKVTSPTFTLVHEHPGRLLLYHIDAYRLSGPQELAGLGFDELIAPDSAVVVEWADRVAAAMPVDTLWIEINVVGNTQRVFNVRATGETAARCLDAFRAVYR